MSEWVGVYSGMKRIDSTWKLEITKDIEEGVIVLTVAGRLGSETSQQLADTLDQLIHDGTRRILVDLQAVDYLSSAGLRALDEAATELQQSGGQLVVCTVPDPVRLPLALAGLLTKLGIEPSRDAGRRRLRDV